MGLTIESGNGNGEQAGVKQNRLDVSSKTNGRASYVAKEDGTCYLWTHAYDYTGADTILWLTNTSTTKNLYIEIIRISSDTATQFTIHSPVYAAPSGTLVTGANTNRTSGNSADALCYGNEINNAQSTIFVEGLFGANGLNTFPVDGKIILGYHDCIAVDLVTSGSMGIVIFLGYYEDKE